MGPAGRSPDSTLTRLAQPGLPSARSLAPARAPGSPEAGLYILQLLRLIQHDFDPQAAGALPQPYGEAFLKVYGMIEDSGWAVGPSSTSSSSGAEGDAPPGGAYSNLF